MAFSFANAAAGNGTFGGARDATAGVHVEDGSLLPEIETDELGFTALNGEAQVRLLSKPWPTENPPPPTASLLSVASRKGLIAAGGPDALVIATTNSIRESFRASPGSSADKLRDAKPLATIPFEGLSHVYFTSEENVLIAATQGTLCAFQVDQIKDSNATPAFRLDTASSKLSHVIPNPAPESAHLIAVVTAEASLLMVDLSTGQIREGKSGKQLKEGVTCVSWSNKGKQLVAGLSDGTAVQMKPDGTEVATIPKSTSIADGSHVSGIAWLENDLFFVTYTPNESTDVIPPSEYWIVEREASTKSYTFHQLPEILPPYGVERLPSFHFITRLRTFNPDIVDLLIVTATTSTDVSLVVKAKKSLSSDVDVKDIFTFAMVGNDSRRAQLPLSPDMLDTSPIGMILDLSSDESVPNPIPADPEILETKGPVPCLMILNNEGVLVAWWLIYNDSVREGTKFAGFDNLATSSTAAVSANREKEVMLPPKSETPSAFSNSTSSQSPFATQSSFAKPASSNPGAFGTGSSFGTSSTSAFGNTSAIGASGSSWTSAGFGTDNKAQQPGMGFGKPAFGSASLLANSNASVFGTSSAFGKPSSSQSPTSIAPAFGQISSFGTAKNEPTEASSSKTLFGGAGNSTTSGFASFSKSSGFGGFGTQSGETQASQFGGATAKSIFSQPSSENPFATQATASPFGTFSAGGSKSAFGSGDSFKMDSSFTADGTAKDDLPKPKAPSGFGFGRGFGDLLNEPTSALSPTRDAEADMGDDDAKSSSGMSQDSGKEQKQTLAPEPRKIPSTLVTPPASFGPPKATPAPSLSGLFGSSNQNQTTTPFAQPPATGWSFGNLPSTTPNESPSAPKNLFGNTTTFGTTPTISHKSEPINAVGPTPATREQPIIFTKPPPKIKQEPPSDDEAVDLGDIPDAPLPPDPVSKPPFSGSADTSASSKDSMPLPAEDAKSPAPKFDSAEEEEEVDDDEEEDEFSSDFEGSEEDATGDISPIEEPVDDTTGALQMSPESSMKSENKSHDTSPIENVFSSKQNIPQTRPLFGEIGKTPIFPPPKPMQSPRSPSPVRNLLSSDGLRTEVPRSASSPVPPKSVIEQRKQEYNNSAMAAQAAKAREEQITQERARQEAQMKAKVQVAAQQEEPLEDDEDERIRNELEAPISPNSVLDAFIPYQSKTLDDNSKSGIPAQIERLYQDINSMVYVLGINARSLSSYVQHQQTQKPSQAWPDVLLGDSPLDAMNIELSLNDIARLHQGQSILESSLSQGEVSDIAGKIQQCQTLLAEDLFELRTKLTAMRKILLTRTQANIPVTAPLSAEQASVQHDLRKASASAQTKLVQMEDALAVLRAKLAEHGPALRNDGKQSMFGRMPVQKKPTVEAVTNTVAKMTVMAEKKSADIDVLEAQLKKLNFSLASPSARRTNGTPVKGKQMSAANTPKSATSSVYHTPESKLGSSIRTTPARALRNGQAGSGLSDEDRQRYQAKAQRQKAVSDMLRMVLDERRAKQKK